MKQVTAATAWQLSKPETMSALACYFKGQAETANLVRDKMCASVWEWSMDGNQILMPSGEQLDVDRMERLGEASVYSVKGEVILLEKSVRLTRLDDAFGQNTRRTLNRLFEKIGQPTKQRVDRRLLPLMFWMDVVRKIHNDSRA